MSSASPQGIGPRTHQGKNKMDGAKLTIFPRGAETKQDKSSWVKSFSLKNPLMSISCN